MSIVNATFTSVWDDSITVSTPCKVNTETKEVFDIVKACIDGVDILTKQYITFENGDEEPVFDTDELEDDAIGKLFWYEPF